MPSGRVTPHPKQQHKKERGKRRRHEKAEGANPTIITLANFFRNTERKRQRSSRPTTEGKQMKQ